MTLNNSTFNVKEGLNDDGLKTAASFVKSCVYKDREHLDLSVLLNCHNVQYNGTVSGLQEHDYPNINLPQVSNIKNIPLPPELVEQFSHVQCNSLIGVFPDIGRIWITVDSDIFLWHYSNGEGLAYFDGLSEAIFNVALVKPKEGIFQPHIKYLLVITTMSDIVILGVSFTDNDVNNEMHLMPDPLFTLPAENSGFQTIGTDSGRIFTGGKDGCLYEITYKAVGGWFGRNCNKINHSKSLFSVFVPKFVSQWLSEEDGICQICEDDTRNILYTRSDKSTIVAYDLGLDGQGISYVARLTVGEIKSRAMSVCANVGPSNCFEIVHIAPVTKRESKNVHLVAITQSGIRLYFVTSINYQSSSATQNTFIGVSLNSSITDVNTRPTVTTNMSERRPNVLTLVHVRLPPGFTPTGITQKPSSVMKAYSNNSTVLLSAESPDGHKLWCIRRPSFPDEKILMETHMTLQLDGKLWVMSEVSKPFDPRSIAPLPSGVNVIPPDPPIQVQQHFKTANEFVTITDQGCYIFNILRPVDQLRYLLETTNDVNSDKVKSFFDVFGAGEAISAAIIIATSNASSDDYLKDRAVAAFYAYAGMPAFGARDIVQQPQTQQQQQFLPSGLMSPIQGRQTHNFTHVDPNTTTRGFPVISTPMPNTYSQLQPASNFTFAQQASLKQPMAAGPSEICFSNMHAGLYKNFSRLIRPVWESRFVNDIIVQRGKLQETVVVCCLETDLISFVINDLQGFKVFLEKFCLPKLPKMSSLNQLLDETIPSGTYTQPSFKSQSMAMAEESKSILHLYALTKKTIEILGLWRIASTHQMHVLCKNIEKSALSILKVSTLENFVLNSKELSSMLISAFVNFYIDDNSAIDVLNDQLQEVCPSLYSPDDAVCSKAFELVSTARSTTGNQRRVQLEEALHLFQQVSHVVNVPAVVQQFICAQYYTGVVEVCSTAAFKCDEKNMALHYYKNINDPDNDVEGRNAFVTRNDIYRSITLMLDDLIAASQNNAQTTAQIGPPQPATEHAMSQEEAERQAEQCIQLALKSSDELLHIVLYQWMLQRGFSKKLLNVKSPYVETYLKKITSDQSGYSIDLLWTYYERNSDHTAAAKILANLADMDVVDMKLSQRIEYLSRAKMNCKSTSTGSDIGQMLHTLEEKLEVAQIQLLVLNTLKNKNLEANISVELDSQLVDITTLYNDYADAYHLAECKLAIVHCAGHYDSSLVNTLWQDIIKETLQSNIHKPAQSQASSVTQKIVRLGKQYVGSGRYFPVTFLVSYLEKVSCERGWPIDSVVLCLLDCGVTFAQLFKEYDSVYALKEDCWNNWGRPYHLVAVLSSMLEKFSDCPSHYITGPMQRQFTTHSLDVLAVYLVQLQSISIPTDHLNDIKQKLKNNQAKIKRLELQLSHRF